MSDQIELLDGEIIVAELAASSDYINHRNQIVCITDQRLVFLKKKTIGAYYVIEYPPLSDCTQISYKKSFALASMIGGGFLAAIGLLVFAFAVTGQLENFGAVIYGVPLIGVGGALVFGVKRHKLLFQCSNRTYAWVSKAGGFKKKLAVLGMLREFAFQRGIIVEDF